MGTGWKTINESDVIDLPNFIGYGCATEQLGVMLQSLERIYQGSRYEPLVGEVCKRIKNPACIDARQACVEELLVHKDVPSHAWKLYEMEQQLPFLLKIAPTVPDEALPMALSRVCALSRTLPASDSFDLLTVYLNRLLRQNGPYCASYKPKLIELLEPLLAADPLLRLQLFSKPLISDELPVQESSLLKDLISIATAEPSVWWGHFQSVQRVLKERGTYGAFHNQLATIFMQVHHTSPLSGQAGFAEVYAALADGLSDVKLRFAFFVKGCRREEADVLALPDFIGYGVEAGNLKGAIKSLERVYQATPFAPLFSAIRSKILALESPTTAACRTICNEQFLVCEYPQILSAAWAIPDMWTSLF